MRQLGLFAKYWEPGQVKTRLAESIGDQAASRLHREFLANLLATFQSFDARRILGYWPRDRRSEFAQLAGPSWNLMPQTAGHLGARIRAYFADAAEAGQQRTVLIGADSPTLSTTMVQDAFDQLNQHEVVIGPARDGGYYLIGCRGIVADIFEEIDWGSDRVFEQTMRQLKSSGLSYAVLTEWYDIDRLDDLLALYQELTHPLPGQACNPDLVKTVGQVVEELSVEDRSKS